MSPESATEPEPTREPRVAAALLLVANVLFFWPVLFHGRVFSSHGAVNAVYPWHADDGDPRNALLADPASAGAPFLRELPERILWNRSAAGGAPGAVNIVQGFLSPFAWVPALLLPEAAVETGILFLKLNAGFFFLFVYLRRHGLSETAASCGAAAWGWSGAQSAWWLWMQSSVTIAIPLLLLALDRARHDARFSRAIALSSLLLVVYLSGGYPFMILFGGAAGAAYALGAAWRRPAAESWRAAGRIAASGALALGLLLPAILVSARMIRASGQVAARAGLAD
ncbi:MAG TPA: hypothetical protein VKH46_07045, partial [Thermoanaerobaculia bacterium]|nr:hypothetical protein [Thermoanaerobaculia bacterium]